MTTSYYRDLGDNHDLIMASDNGNFAIDLDRIVVGSIRSIKRIPDTAVQIQLADVGRLLLVATTKTMRESEAGMEAVE